MKLTLNKNQRLWFTSDTHYDHTNICYSTSQWTDKSRCRKFDSLDQMNNTLVKNINNFIRQDDILFHLGDWSFGGFEQIQKFRDQIVCKNIHIITGNHDHHIENNRNDVQSLFSSVNKYLELTVKWQDGGTHTKKQDFVLMHFPIASWNDMSKGTIHLHGHVHFEHNLRLQSGKMMDVGVDGNHFHPINLLEIIKIMNFQPVKSLFKSDHHE